MRIRCYDARIKYPKVIAITEGTVVLDGGGGLLLLVVLVLVVLLLLLLVHGVQGGGRLDGETLRLRRHDTHASVQSTRFQRDDWRTGSSSGNRTSTPTSTRSTSIRCFHGGAGVGRCVGLVVLVRRRGRGGGGGGGVGEVAVHILNGWIACK